MPGVCGVELDVACDDGSLGPLGELVDEAVEGGAHGVDVGVDFPRRGVYDEYGVPDYGAGV